MIGHETFNMLAYRTRLRRPLTFAFNGMKYIPLRLLFSCLLASSTAPRLQRTGLRQHVRALMRFLIALVIFGIYGLAYAEPFADLVRVSKAEHKLQVISAGKVLFEFQVALGGNPIGHKTQEGDGKTPEGAYILDYKKPDSAFHKAIHISYPNANDISSAKARGVNPGGQVMIHGQRNNFGWLSFVSQRFDWTNGCIALHDNDMDTLWSLIREGTKVEILP